ncbi:MAG: TadE/TadG family type IV pilus assembly protein [Anaerolineae bacterium]
MFERGEKKRKLLASPDRPRRGQGLVEFALILPILLLVVWGLFEFARIFQGYLTVQQAAREGARYAVTGQYILINDDDGIPGNFSPGEVWASRAQSIISTTHNAGLGLVKRRLPGDMDTPAQEWTPGQDTPFYYDVVLDPPDGGDPYGISDRDTITVTVHYNVPLLTPLIRDIVGGVVHVTGQTVMQNEAFDPTPGARLYTPIPLESPTPSPTGQTPTPTPTAGAGGGPTLTPTPTTVITQTATPTITSTATAVPPSATPTITPTATNTPAPTINVQLNEPLNEGDTIVTGTGEPGETVTLRDFSQPGSPVIGTGVIQADGTFSISVPALIGGHIIVASAATSTDFAIVVGTATPTPTPTLPPSMTCFTSSHNESNIPGSSSIGTFTLTNFAGIDDGDELEVIVNDGGHIWEYRIKFKGNPAIIKEIRIKYDANKVYENKNLSLPLSTTVDLLNINAVTGDTSNYDYDSTAFVNISSSNTMSVNFKKDNGAPGSACLTIEEGTASPPVGAQCFTSTYVTQNMPSSNGIQTFTVSDLSGIDDGDELKATVTDASHVWEYRLKFKGNPVVIEEIRIKYDGNKVYENKNLSLSLTTLVDLLSINAVTGDTTNYDYDSFPTVNIGGSNNVIISFTKDNGATAGACVTIEGTTPTPTPSPTPALPDLVVAGMSIAPVATVDAGQPITVEVVVENQGLGDLLSISWLHFYMDPSPAPPTVNQDGYAWAAIDSLAAGTQITVTFSHPGFVSEGTHQLYAQIDVRNQIVEESEVNNLYGPITLTVSIPATPVPTPTLTPTPAPNNGSISGSTWLLLNGDLVPMGFVTVEARSGGSVVATTVSDASGNYNFGMVLPPGTYDVYGQTVLNNVVYSDLITGVTVTSNNTTQFVTLILH